MRTDVNIRRPQLNDLHHLIDIDLKCFEDTLLMEEWRDYLDSELGEMLICVLNHVPAGYIIWKHNQLLRLAVKPASSYLGLGTRLLQAVENILIRRGSESIVIDVPESLCSPGQPHDTSEWLLHKGFKATKVNHSSATFCGHTEDSFSFTKMLAEAPIYG